MTAVKALTLTQPWATLVATGHKQVETRSWRTHYRGPLVIHAAKGFPRYAKQFAKEEYLVGRLPDRIPYAAVVAIVTLRDCVPAQDIVNQISGLERRLGDYSFGRWAWILEDVKAFPDPVGCRGALGLWNWDPPGNYTGAVEHETEPGSPRQQVLGL